jgi:hypothetical protein
VLKLDIAGLPLPAAWQAWARALAGFVVIALVALAIVIAVRRPAQRSAPTAAERRNDLYARRDRLYEALVALERARVAGKIEPAAFDAQRKGIMTRLVLVHRELDELDAMPEGAPPADDDQARTS